MFLKIKLNIIAVAVEINEEIHTCGNIPVASKEPAASLNAMTFVGMN